VFFRCEIFHLNGFHHNPLDANEDHDTHSYVHQRMLQ
jgi:hypothetical protein